MRVLKRIFKRLKDTVDKHKDEIRFFKKLLIEFIDEIEL